MRFCCIGNVKWSAASLGARLVRAEWGGVCRRAEEEEDEGEAKLPPLVAPALPPVGDYLDVNVMVAANPLNFVCQPWLNGGQLSQLMAEMQVGTPPQYSLLLSTASWTSR